MFTGPLPSNQRLLFSTFASEGMCSAIRCLAISIHVTISLNPGFKNILYYNNCNIFINGLLLYAYLSTLFQICILKRIALNDLGEGKDLEKVISCGIFQGAHSLALRSSKNLDIPYGSCPFVSIIHLLPSSSILQLSNNFPSLIPLHY